MTEGRAKRTLTARKLLGVTLGLASVSFVGAACTTGNLVVDAAPPVQDAPQEPRDGSSSDPETDTR